MRDKHCMREHHQQLKSAVNDQNQVMWPVIQQLFPMLLSTDQSPITGHSRILLIKYLLCKMLHKENKLKQLPRSSAKKLKTENYLTD